MIKKTSRGYKVVSENTSKNLGGPYKLGQRPKSACAKWSSSNAAEASRPAGIYRAISSRRRRVVRGPRAPISANTISMLQAMKTKTPVVP